MTNDELKKHKAWLLINEPKAMAKQRLMDFAASLSGDTDYDDQPYEDVTYEELIKRATDYQECGDYWDAGPRFEGQSIYQGFWDDYALVTQRPVNDTWGFFSCSC
jgi:hypothetical protein